MRKIPLKNYIVYILLCFFTVILLCFFVNRVKDINGEKRTELSDCLYEIKKEKFFVNLTNYVIDNPEFVLYISNSNQNYFEDDLKQYILQNDLKDNIIYFNGWNNLDNEFLKYFKTQFFSSSITDIHLDSLKQSNMYKFKEGEIVSVLYTDDKRIDINDVKKFLEKDGEIIYD